MGVRGAELVSVFVIVLVLMSVPPLGLAGSFRDPVDCTYASSVCTTCVDLCTNTSTQFYNLLPSVCHPDSLVSMDAYDLRNCGSYGTEGLYE